MNGQETGLEPGLLEACARAGQINEDNLRRLLADNRDTVYGKKYGFGSMETSAEYRKRVPLSSYASLQPYLDRMAQGEQKVLTAYPAAGSLRTSGTEGGSKRIPVTFASLERYSDQIEWYKNLAHKKAGGKRLFVNGFRVGLTQEKKEYLLSELYYQYLFRNGFLSFDEFAGGEETLFGQNGRDILYAKVWTAFAVEEITTMESIADTMESMLSMMSALLGGIACFGIGNIAQSTEIAGAMESLVGLPPLWTGIILAILTAIVVIGGVQRIGQVASYLVPFMAIFYIVAGVAVIALRITEVPAALAAIFQGAFSFEAVGGGVFGYAIMQAMRQGFARGVFSNEAGLGSAPMAHAASNTKEPVEQGMWGVFEVFVDTIIICTLTSMAVLLSGVLEYDLNSFASNGAAAAAAFNAILPGSIGGTVLQISLLFFALSTILGWSYYGERCWGYLTNNNKAANLIFKVAFVLVCIVGAVGSGSLMWDISDTLNGMMAIPNLIGLLLLSGTVIQATKTYFSKH